MIKKSGFTLAEVLTTLMVIGVVAAMTIPTLMNSTNDQQLKVAYKKALSVLGQGVQLMTAKEEQCVVGTSAKLAECFQKHVISGTYNSSNATVQTSDGMVYKFIYKGTNSNESRTLEEICGDLGSSQYTGYNGAGYNCAVVVDLNGTGKGSKSFNTDPNNLESITTKGSDQLPILVTGTGVRPMYFSDQNSGYINNGWKYMFDTTP